MPPRSVRCLGCSNAEPFEVVSSHGASLSTLRCQVCGLRYAFCELENPDDPGTPWHIWLPMNEERAETFSTDPTPATLLGLCQECVYWVSDEEKGRLTGEIVKMSRGEGVERLKRVVEG